MVALISEVNPMAPKPRKAVEGNSSTTFLASFIVITMLEFAIMLNRMGLVVAFGSGKRTSALTAV